MSRHKLIKAALLLLIFTSLFLQKQNIGYAQSVIQVETDEALLTFPEELQFHLVAKSSSEITQVTLQYGSNTQSCVNSIARQTANFTPATNVDAEWTWDFTDSGNLPPGAEVWWQWTIADSNGNQMTTDRQEMTIEDDAFTWQTIENPQVKLAWAKGSRTFADRLLKLATDSLEHLENNAGIHSPGQVRLTIYPDFDSLRAALIFTPEWTGGVAFPEFGVSIIGIPTDSGDWADEVIPHELTHLVIGQVTFNCLGSGLPTWLTEGLAVANEGPAGSDEQNDIRSALEQDELPALRTLAAGFSANADDTYISYSQSGEVVRFLLREYGADKMAELLQTIKTGKLIDPALEQVYGFNTDGLDVLWRFSLGFGDGQLPPTPTPTAISTAVPTMVLATPAFGGSKTSTPTPVEVSQVASPTARDTEVVAEINATSVVDVQQISKTAQSAAATAINDNPPKQQPTFTCSSGALIGLIFSLFVFYSQRSRWHQ